MNFSELETNYREVTIDYIHQRWEQLYQLEKEWGDKAVKFLFLTNSGGAIASLSFLGTVTNQNLWAKLALVSFIVGILFVAVIIARAHKHMSNLFEGYQKDVDLFYKDMLSVDELYKNDSKRVESFSWEYLFPYTSLGCFISGCALGGFGLFCS